MEAWVGPAIVAAVISGTISLLGLYLGGLIAIRHDRRRRQEKVRDYQTALKAEIRGDLHNLASIDFGVHLAEITARYARQPDFVVFPTYPTASMVFDAIRGEIHILPEPVIDVIVLYFRQKQAVLRLVEDMRDQRFARLEPERQLHMYEDYLGMQKYLLETARLSVRALETSLDPNPGINNPAGDRSGR